MGMWPQTVSIRERLNVEYITERFGKVRLRWFGDVKRRDQDSDNHWRWYHLRDEEEEDQNRAGWMDCVNSDMRAIWTTEHEVHDRTGWRKMLSATATHTH